MARYIQRIALLGKERWIAWEIDGVGTELPGLTLADHYNEGAPPATRRYHGLDRQRRVVCRD
jgi:hypothetical protein